MYVRSSYLLKRIPVSWITSIDIEPIARCNLQCPFCQVPGWRRADETESMTPELFSRIIGQFPRLKHVKLQGMGEPFLSPYTIDLIRLASARGLKTTILSNGTLLSADLANDILKAGLSTLYISFDGATRETYESLRVGADYGLVLDNIQHLLKLRAQRGATTGIRMRCLISNQAVLDELPKQVRLAAALGVDELLIASRCKIWEPRDGNPIPVLSVPNHDFRESAALFNHVQKLAKECGLCLNLGRYLPHGKWYPCSGPWRTMFVSVEGKVVPCSHIANPDSWCLGSLVDEEVQVVWNGDAYAKLRRSILKNNTVAFCNSCYADTCKGHIGTSSPTSF